MNTTTSDKILVAAASFLLVFCLIFPAEARRYPSEKKARGGFEMSGYLNTAAGWQRFSNDPITEVADDGSFAGPIGEWLPLMMGKTVLPRAGSSFFEFFIPKLEIDIRKRFGDRARLVGDLQFGRIESGSAFGVPGINVTHAYGAVTLYKPRNVELWIGRLGLQAGFEPYEDYLNDTVSYSILWRALVSPPNATGVQVTGDVTDNVHYYFILSNGTIHDSSIRFSNLPSIMSTWIINWGPATKQSGVVITPYAGPESNTNSDWSVGIDAYTYWWLTDKFQLGLEGTFQRDDATRDGPTTYYAAALVNLHWDFARSWYVVWKYAYAGQYDNGNGVLNLTGTKQNIHEAAIGFGHWITDQAKVKFEGRLDMIDPAASNDQFVGGLAMSMNYAF